jgi:hypothetical protein
MSGYYDEPDQDDESAVVSKTKAHLRGPKAKKKSAPDTPSTFEADFDATTGLLTIDLSELF